MKFLFLGFIFLASQSCNSQSLILKYECHDLKIISEYTGDTIDRCELILNKKKSLAKLGREYTYDKRWDTELRDLYHFGKDIFHYSHDTSLQHVGCDIFTNKFKLLVDNQYLVQVGGNIDSYFKQYAPIPIVDDRGEESAVFITYQSPKGDNEFIQSHYAIRFNKKNRLIVHIGDYKTGSVYPYDVFKHS